MGAPAVRQESRCGGGAAPRPDSLHKACRPALSPFERSTVQALDTWQEDNDNTWREPLSRAQAQALMRAKPGVSALAVVALQLAVTLAAGLLGWALAGRAAGLSAAWGGAVVVLPAALFAAAMRRWLVRLPPAYALFGFAFGELLKIAATVALLLLAPRLLGSIHWPALLLGLLAALQVYWIALLLRGKPRALSSD